MIEGYHPRCAISPSEIHRNAPKVKKFRILRVNISAFQTHAPQPIETIGFYSAGNPRPVPDASRNDQARLRGMTAALS